MKDDDHYFAYYKHSDSDGNTTSSRANSSASEHPPPLRLTATNEDEEHEPTIPEIVRHSEVDGDADLESGRKALEKASQGAGNGRRYSTSSQRSRMSALSVEDIYGVNADPDYINLRRERTRETMMSRVTKVVSNAYSDIPATSVAQDNVLADGSEYIDIDPELVTWDGPDDPGNPRNWHISRKWVTMAIVSLYTTVSPLSSSIPSPAVPAIAESLHMDKSIEQSLAVSIFVLAWAICPLFVAPLSEVFGRQIVLNISIVLLLIFNIACALAQTPAQLLVFRFLAGLAGAPPLSVGAGTMADLFSDQARNTPMALYSLGPTLGPVIAPIIAGWAVQGLGWRWVFWILSIINGVVALSGLFFYRETFAPILLKRKAKKLRAQTGNQGLHTIFEINQENLSRKLVIAVSRPITMLFTNPIIFGLGLFMAFVYGFMYLMFVTFASLWTGRYHYSVGISGTMYLGLGVGFVAATAFWTPLLQKTFVMLTKRNNGVLKPEYRLFLVVYMAIVMAVGLFWYGWSAEARIHWVMPVIGTGLFGFGLMPTFICIQNYLIDMNPRFSASSVAAAAVFRSCFGFGFPLFGKAMYDRLGYGWANTLCGILCLVLGIPFPLVVYFYGERVRQWMDDRLEKRYA